MVAAAVLAASLVAAPLGAQGSATADCKTESLLALSPGEIGKAWADRHPAAFDRRMAPLAAAGRWTAIVDSLVLGVEGVPGVADPVARAAMLAELRGARAQADSAERDPAFARQGRATPPRFHVDQDEDASGNVVYYVFRNLPSPAAPTHRIRVDDATPQDQRRALCWTALSTEMLLNEINGSGRDAAVRHAQERVRRWDGYTQLGYSQLPLELAVNQLWSFGARDLEPPRGQLILLHPSVGVEVVASTIDDGVDDWRRGDALVLEWVGGIVYGPTRRRYAGLSLVSTFPTGETPGLGAMAHVVPNVRWLPNVHGGYVWRRRQAGVSRNSLLVTVDLYDWLAETPRRLREKRDQAREAALRCLRTPATCAQAAQP